jgi:GT2 family glycosyltransferase/glycosyltransferase involved in cell wall biosynthesis
MNPAKRTSAKPATLDHSRLISRPLTVNLRCSRSNAGSDGAAFLNRAMLSLPPTSDAFPPIPRLHWAEPRAVCRSGADAERRSVSYDHQSVTARTPRVSIVIPVFNRLAFTTQCLDRLWRHTEKPSFEVIVVDNGSTDGTRKHFEARSETPARLQYLRNETNLGFGAANNQGARAASGRYLVFLNNDTLVRPGWLGAMVRLADSDTKIGVVGIQQLFPYTHLIHHTGIVFTADGMPQHLYPHSPASLPHVNKERDYQAVNGACLLISRTLFEECGGFDEGYRNGYEDIDLCLTVRNKGRRVVCCTSASIYHYGQITETRTVDDGANAGRFREKWGGRVRPDEHWYFREDVGTLPLSSPRRAPVGEPLVYLADDLGPGSAFTWAGARLASALVRLGVGVALPAGRLGRALGKELVRELRPLQVARPPIGGTQVKWTHYWPQHLGRELDGDVNLELFAVNYAFSDPDREPWDHWTQCLRQNHHVKLPISRFCRDVLVQVGVPEADCFVLNLGYSPEIDRIGPGRRGPGFRILTVTNSHDLERYGTALLLEVFRNTFSPEEDVTLVIHDYGAASGDKTLKQLVAAGPERPRIELRTELLSKEGLIRLYRSCDAFVSAHRGEGFGMKILDALACGLPTVVTDFGGSTDFCNEETTLPVACDVVPLGPCLDARSLRPTNGPVWAEPQRASLASRLRWLLENPEEARALGGRAAETIRGRFTWEQAARRLLEVAEVVRSRRPKAVAVEAPLAGLAETELIRSPHWLGTRVSVVVPTFNRKDKLLRCLDALRSQTVLPEEIEVLVVDDGSSDGTAEVLARYESPFRLRSFRQPNQGPGAARNLAIREARGEYVLFLGDDIYADPRLVEEHLEAHARLGDERAAVLGHVGWEPSLPVTPVMRWVCGEGTLQYAYQFIPDLPTLDWRFFYTSNISVSRPFLVEAAEAGIVFDPCFRHAAFEDSEYAWRLMRRGLRIHYVKDAQVVHDHPMDLAGFCAREERAGRMAVIFCRKHPTADRLLEVFWIGERAEAVRTLAADRVKVAELAALDRQTDEALSQTVAGLEARLDEAGERLDEADREAASGALNGALRVIFDAARTRGKVREWYADVRDERLVEAALAGLVCSRKLQQMRSTRPESSRLRADVERLGLDPAASLAAGESAMASAVLPGLAMRPMPRTSFGGLVRHRLLTFGFIADRRMQRVLARPLAAPLRRAYGAARRAARHVLNG